MDRRTFVQAGLSSLLAYNCSFARARAATRIRGCRMAASEESLGITLLGQNEIPEGKLTDLRVIASKQTSSFGLRPGICFFDDSESPNAFALPNVLLLPAGSYRGTFAQDRDHAGYSGPDGTVLMGIKLFDQILPNENFTNRKPGKVGLHTGIEFTLPTIIAHELGHIMQYKRGMSPDPAGPWQMEPHADFLAGWCLGNDRTLEALIREGARAGDWAAKVEVAIKAFFERGDLAFNNPDHHGEPLLRAAMVRAGYESGRLDVNQAFEKGKKFAGLN
jgi:hypothetical protein